MIEQNQTPTVLIVDKDFGVRRLLRASLERNGYHVVEAITGYQAMEDAMRCHPNAVLLDSTLPDMEGMSVLKQLREWSEVPVLMISEWDDEIEKVTALNAGANDYITKPFSTDEVIARLRVTQRYYTPSASKKECFSSRNLSVNLTSREVKVGGEKVRLRPTEYSLLRCFIQNAGKVLTHRQILTSVWGGDEDENMGSLRVHLSCLRAKLENDPSHPELILTEPGIGYRLSAQ